MERFARAVLTVGLLLVAAAFTMLDRGWEPLEPIGPIDEPTAALVGAVGLVICLFGARLFRRRLARPLDPEPDPFDLN